MRRYRTQPTELERAILRDDVMRFIAGYNAATGGLGPTYQEIGNAIGIRSKGHVSRILAQMEVRGLISRMPSRRRSICVLKPVAIPRAPDGAPLAFVPWLGVRMTPFGVAHNG